MKLLQRLGLCAVLLCTLSVPVFAQNVNAPWQYANVVGAGTTVIKSGFGILHLVTVNLPILSGTITMYDNTAGSGNKIGTITLPAVLLGQGPYTGMYDVAFTTGLTLVTTGTNLDITVSYR